MNWASLVPERSTVRARLITKLAGLTCSSTRVSGIASHARAGAGDSAGGAAEAEGGTPSDDLEEVPAAGDATARG